MGQVDTVPTETENATQQIGRITIVSMRGTTYSTEAPVPTIAPFPAALPVATPQTDRVDAVISQADFDALHQHLHSDRLLEQHAFLLAGLSQSSRGTRLLVREMVFAKAADFIRQTASYLDLQPSYYLPAVDRCRNEGLHLIEVHSHPFVDKGVRFSSVDVDNELEKFPWYASQVLAMQLPRWCSDETRWTATGGTGGPDRSGLVTSLRVVGPTLRTLSMTGASAVVGKEDRMEEMFPGVRGPGTGGHC